jgi:predicted nucleotidyltransferase
MSTLEIAEGVTVDRDELAALCGRLRIAAIRLFGSVVRPDFGPDSDLDILVEFEAGVDPDLFTLGGIQQDFCDLFGREVDLKTAEMFSPGGLRHVLRSSRVGYAA